MISNLISGAEIVPRIDMTNQNWVLALEILVLVHLIVFHIKNMKTTPKLMFFF